MITEKLSVRTFILAGPLNLPGPGTMYLLIGMKRIVDRASKCFL